MQEKPPYDIEYISGMSSEEIAKAYIPLTDKVYEDVKYLSEDQRAEWVSKQVKFYLSDGEIAAGELLRENSKTVVLKFDGRHIKVKKSRLV